MIKLGFMKGLGIKKTILHRPKKTVNYTKAALMMGTCRLCGRPTSRTAASQYLLCQRCKMMGIKID
ncbi:MAG: hypothetical protein K6F44_03395 [Lachnospiraceae bacterium]|nr:hypothetical protein [Lachnospiraceae bacterium]